MSDENGAPNKERVRLWVEALRSGKYQQGQGRLKKDDSFCCLGVACDISKVSAWDEYDCYEGGYGALPSSVVDWYGFDENDCDPALRANDGDLALATELNDIAELDFNQIADAVERTFLSEKASE